MRRLLWFDCTAAATAGVAMLALAGLLAPLLGLPRDLILCNGVVNLAYGCFSWALARRTSAPPVRVKMLIAANSFWVGVCVLMSVHFARPGSWAGAVYLLGEGIFVGVLAWLEARALGRQPQPKPARP